MQDKVWNKIPKASKDEEQQIEISAKFLLFINKREQKITDQY